MAFAPKASAKLPNKITYFASKPTQWTFQQVGQNQTTTQTVSQEVLVTWGELNNIFGFCTPTRHRATWAIKGSDGADTLEKMADQLQAKTKSSTTFGGLTSDWTLLDHGSGTCIEQARLMVYAIKMIGGSAEPARAYASTNAGAGNCLAAETRAGGSEQLFLDFTGGGPLPDWNYFEGCCVAANHFYSITPKHKETDDYSLLKSLGAKQYWVKVTFFEDGSFHMAQKMEEVPIP